jgi:hypothetical protein
MKLLGRAKFLKKKVKFVKGGEFPKNKGGDIPRNFSPRGAKLWGGGENPGTPAQQCLNINIIPIMYVQM